MISLFHLTIIGPILAIEPTTAQNGAPTRFGDAVVTAATRPQRVESTWASPEHRTYADLFDAVRDLDGAPVGGGLHIPHIFIRRLPGSYTLTLGDGRRQSTRDARGPQADTTRIERTSNAGRALAPTASNTGNDPSGGAVSLVDYLF